MKVTRRDLLVWSAGAAAGLLATPVPWKLLDDTSIWSQNWPWIPQPLKVPVEIKQSACTLCPKGCGVRVRMAAGWPVGVAGLSTHPISRGALCPLAFAAHQLNWHPQRLRSVLHLASDSSWPQAQAAFAQACKEGPVVIIDGYPGRASSSLFEAFAEKSRGSYRTVASAELRALAPYEAWSGVPASSLGYDLEHARTIVSFGAPLLDGWGTPGRFTRLWAERAAGATDPRLRLIQIDSLLSRTAARAWQWIQIRDGAESTLASGLARALVEQNLVPARGPIPSMSVAESAVQTGLSADAIRELARTLATGTPAVAIARDEDQSIAALNIILGTVGARGGIVRSSRNGKIQTASDGVVQNARAVLIDSSVPWDFDPQTGAEVFRFAAWDGGPTKADWLLPAPGFLEELTDIPTPTTSAVESYSVAPSLAKQPTVEVHSAADFLCKLDSTLTPVEKIVHSRCEELFHQRAGSVYGHEVTAVSKFDSVQKLEEQLWKGAVWIGEPLRAGDLRCHLNEWPTNGPVHASENWDSGWTIPVLPPLASKVCTESNLREAPDRRKA